VDVIVPAGALRLLDRPALGYGRAGEPRRLSGDLAGRRGARHRPPRPARARLDYLRARPRRPRLRVVPLEPFLRLFHRVLLRVHQGQCFGSLVFRSVALENATRWKRCSRRAIPAASQVVEAAKRDDEACVVRWPSLKTRFEFSSLKPFAGATPVAGGDMPATHRSQRHIEAIVRVFRSRRRLELYCPPAITPAHAQLLL
jgi:hypothetical protein